MTKTISIEPLDQKKYTKTVEVKVEHQESTANMQQILKQLGINDFSEKVVVLNEKMVAIDVTKSGIDIANKFYYIVLNRDDSEIAACDDKWVAYVPGEPEDVCPDICTKYAEIEELRNIALHAYGDTSGIPLEKKFPDYNATIREAFVGGVASQTPVSLLQNDDNSTRVGGLPHEPTEGECTNFRNGLLLTAFKNGVAHGVAGIEGNFPTTREAREAYRRGKEVVLISLADKFSSVTLDAVKISAVPTEYAEYVGGVSHAKEEEADRRSMLRTIFLQGIEDAWNARSQSCVTAVTASHRVSEKPAILDMYQSGFRAAKRALQSCGKCEVCFEENQVIVKPTDDLDIKGKGQLTAFQKGLKRQWKRATIDVSKKDKVDKWYPNVAAERRAAYADGPKAKAINTKKEEDLKRHEENEAKKDLQRKLAERTCKDVIVDEVTELGTNLKDVCNFFCCDLLCSCKRDEEEKLQCMDTACGDWFLILLCFLVYYCYLGMWYWAFIEILMVVAEPQRPW